MTYAESFTPLNLLKMPFDEQMRIFNNEILLADNFCEQPAAIDLATDKEAAALIRSPYPFKMLFHMGIFCRSGQMRARLNLSEYTLRRNDLLVILNGDIGQCLEITPDCQLGIVAIANDFALPEIHSQAGITLRKYLTNSSLVHLEEAEMEELYAVYQAMRHKIENKEFRYTREVLRLQLMTLYYLCCNSMAPHVAEQENETGPRMKEIYNEFMQLVHKHYRERRDVRFYADKLCLTPKYLSQTVYAFSGRHASDWIRDYVILEAKALLNCQRYTVQQVSDLLHFANQSFFGVYFKKAVGCSPTAYRNGL